MRHQIRQMFFTRNLHKFHMVSLQNTLRQELLRGQMFDPPAHFPEGMGQHRHCSVKFGFLAATLLCTLFTPVADQVFLQHDAPATYNSNEVGEHTGVPRCPWKVDQLLGQSFRTKTCNAQISAVSKHAGPPAHRQLLRPVHPQSPSWQCFGSYSIPSTVHLKRRTIKPEDQSST